MVLVGQKPHQVKGGRSNPDTASTVPCEANLSAPRPCLQVQPRVLDALKAALALVDQLVQQPSTRVQIRVPDPVGVKQDESHLTAERRALLIAPENVLPSLANPLVSAGTTTHSTTVWANNHWAGGFELGSSPFPLPVF
jgi:hypothetical protein